MRLSSKLAILYVASTLIFLLLHTFYQGWDFSAYVLNAKYWFGHGEYFEISRAPLTSVLLGLLSVFGWKPAEYLYIILVSFLFLISSVTLARSLHLHRFTFYLLSLNVFVLVFGLVEGTDLLAFSFLELFLAFLLRDRTFSSVFLALACLTRYPFVLYFPLIAFHKSWKKRSLAVVFFVAPFLPWFVYNLAEYGNILYSIADSYALNVFYRDYVPHAVNLASVLHVFNILLPLSVLGVVPLFLRKEFLREKILILASTVITLFSVYSIKASVARYYLPLTIFVASTAMYGLGTFQRKWRPLILILFALLTFWLLFLPPFSFVLSGTEGYAPVLAQISDIENCSLQSNIWVPLTYLGRTTAPFPRQELVQKSIDDGNYILLYYNSREPGYATNRSFLSQFPIHYETDTFIVLGSGCAPVVPVTYSYLTRLNNELRAAYNYTLVDNPCILLFPDSLCAVVNYISANG